MPDQVTLWYEIVLEVEPVPWYETALLYGGLVAIFVLLVAFLAFYYRAFQYEPRTEAER